MKTLMVTLAVVAILVMGCVTEATPFQNGSFENYNVVQANYATDNQPLGITGWEVTAPGGQPWGISRIDWGSFQMAGGPPNYNAVLLAWMLPGGIKQTFDTIAGHQYRVDFVMAGNPGSSIIVVRNLTVTAAATSTQFTFNTTGKSNSNMGWAPRSLMFTANGTQSTLEFSSTDALSDYFYGPAIDNVSVTDISSLIGIGAAKKLPDDAAVCVSGVITAVFADCFYVQTADRSSGIRVELPGYFAVVGSDVQVYGQVETLASEERYIAANTVQGSAGQSPAPIGMSNKSVGGGDFGAPPQGQMGVAGGVGLNNIGLLIRTTGLVSDGKPTAGFFRVSDGSCDPVEAVLSNGSSLPPDGSYVTVTGISSCSLSGSSVERRILVTTWTMNDAGSFDLVQTGNSAVIVLGAQKTSAERHAADELVKYVKAMCGANLPIIESDNPTLNPSTNTILIGRAETNPKIMDLRTRGLINLSLDSPGLDGFIIRTVVAGPTEPKYLILGGSIDRGTTYAVYHLLEKILHVGFFEDGEYVPKSATVLIPALNIAERPVFQIRSYPGAPTLFYKTRYWLQPEWEYEADFCAKKKQNLLLQDNIWSNWAYMKRQVEASYDPPVTDGTFLTWTDVPCASDEWDMSFTAGIQSYIRTNLGLQVMDTGGADGDVSTQFMQAHPEIPYLISTWIGGGVGHHYIDPRNPAFTNYVAKWVSKDRQLRGADHWLWQGINGGETSDGYMDPDHLVSNQIRAAFANGLVNGLHSVDPQGVVYAEGWSYGWQPPDDVKAFITAFPYDSFVTTDTWGDANPGYTVYCDPGGPYYYGKKWLMGTLHSFGGDECMFGAMQQTIDRHKNILLDPRASNCIGTQIFPETICHNPIYWDLLMDVTWNPNHVTVSGQLKDIALRRYGSASAAALYPALDLLAQSVYASPYHAIMSNPPYAPRPVYRRLMYDFIERDTYAARANYIPMLRQAVEIMLTEKDKQVGNKLYDNDLVDFCKQYIAELINYHYVKMYDAFKAGDSTAFEASAGYIGKCFGSLILILSSNSRYYLDTEIKQMVAYYAASGRSIPAPGATPYLQCAALARQKANPAATEYCSEDRLELVKYYYRSKMQIYISVLRAKLSGGNTTIAQSDLYDQYMQLRDNYWASDNYNLKSSDIYNGTVAQAAAQVLTNLASVPQPQ